MSELWRLSARELAAGIGRGEFSSLDAVEAHVARIEAVDGDINAVVVRRYDEARAEARAADERRARGDALGALHGVPVSIKESQDVAGTPATYGLPSRDDDVAATDGASVARWRDAGAIVLGKTNVSQLLIYLESDNPLYGRTNNPWNLARTPGGSSGGEGALIAAGGSPLGLGTDIGGSLRVPAAFCAIVSLKPTTGRLDDTSRIDAFAGMRAIVSQEGPLARTTADVALGYRLACGDDVMGRRIASRSTDSSDAADVSARRVRFANDARAFADAYDTRGDVAALHARVRGLRVGWYGSAGMLAASPALARASREAADLLAKLGAHVVSFLPPRVEDAMAIFYGLLSADGTERASTTLGDNPRDPRVAQLFDIASKPRAQLAAIERLLTLGGQRQIASVVRNYGYTDTHHYWQLIEAQRAYADLFERAMDTSDGGALDVIIAPPVGLPALVHGAAADVLTAGAYAPLYNLLGYPTGTLPFTRVRASEESHRRPSRDRVERAAAKTERGSAGLPVGVQIVARPWCEDLVLDVMAALESLVRGRDDFPTTPVDPARS